MRDSQVENHTANAVRTNEGFIEVTSLELLADMVGGLINPESSFCELLDEEAIELRKNRTSNGI